MNKCHSRESFLRKTNLQHAMHNFYWYIIEYYFTSDPFSTEQSTKCSGKNIYAVGIEIVCIERYIGTFLYFFLFCFCFTILFLSTVGFCVVPTESGRQQHRVYGRKYFLCGYECIVRKIYIKAYIETRQTKRTPTDGSETSPFLTSIFILIANSRLVSARRRAETWRSQIILSSLRLFFFPLLRNI